jgi:putative restriction endonuclease
VSADEHAALAGLLPEGAQRSTGSAPPAPRPPALTPQELLARATSLRQHDLAGRASRHQPLTLLWAIGQLVAGAPRLHRWSSVQREVGALLAEFGGEVVSATPEFPFWHLQQTGLWDVPGPDADDPSAGFIDEAFTLLKDVRLRTRTINALRSRYLADVQDQDTLLTQLGLAGYATASGLEQPDGQSGGPARRRSSTGSVIERNSRLGEFVKALHDHRCQLCETQLLTATGFYSEAAHIRGLGTPHDGPDELGNMLCLCANCHIQFDRFALYIDDADVVRHVRDQREIGVLRRHERHTINDEQIRYHRSLCDIPGAQPDATDE